MCNSSNNYLDRGFCIRGPDFSCLDYTGVQDRHQFDIYRYDGDAEHLYDCLPLSWDRVGYAVSDLSRINVHFSCSHIHGKKVYPYHASLDSSYVYSRSGFQLLYYVAAGY